MSSVGIIECKSYNEAEVKEAFRIISTPFAEEKAQNLKDKSVVIYFDFPLPHLTVLKEVIEFLKKSGVKKITAGTSIFAHPLPEEYKNLFAKYGIQFVDFRKDKYVKLTVPLHTEKMPDHFRGFGLLSPVQYSKEKQIEKMGIKGKRTLKNAFIPITIVDSDYVIPVVKLKVSPVSTLGGIVNATLSLVPTMTRNEILVRKLKFGEFENALVEAYALIKDRIAFGVVDAVQGELTGDKEIDRIGAILFSEDGLALDSLSAVLIGYRSRDVKTNKAGDDMGFGSGLFAHVSLYGDEFLRFRKELKNILKYGGKRRKRIPAITNPADKRIEKIEFSCPIGAIKKTEQGYTIDKKICFGCMLCVELLPEVFTID